MYYLWCLFTKTSVSNHPHCWSVHLWTKGMLSWQHGSEGSCSDASDVSCISTWEPGTDFLQWMASRLRGANSALQNRGANHISSPSILILILFQTSVVTNNTQKIYHHTCLKGATVTVSEDMYSTSGSDSHFDLPRLRKASMICLDALWSSGRVTRKSMSTSTWSLLCLLVICTFSAGPFLVMVTRSESSIWLLLDISPPSM